MSAMPAWLQQSDNPIADTYALGYQAGEENARPKWRLVDVNDPTTMPAVGAKILVSDGLGHQLVVTVVAEGKAPVNFSNGGEWWPREYRCHWMPWSDIGDPS